VPSPGGDPAARRLYVIDWTLSDGVRDIPIERRDGRELSHIEGRSLSGALETVAILPEVSEVANYGFDVTPAQLVPALITERGVCPASEAGLLSLYPERRSRQSA
jgi:methylthioribose-1-phosphate isomerase